MTNVTNAMRRAARQRAAVAGQLARIAELADRPEPTVEEDREDFRRRLLAASGRNRTPLRDRLGTALPPDPSPEETAFTDATDRAVEA